MVLTGARCSNWPSLPHGQLRPVLSPQTIASLNQRSTDQWTTGAVAPPGFVGIRVGRKMRKYISPSFETQTSHRQVRQSCCQVVCQEGGTQEQDDKPMPKLRHMCKASISEGDYYN